MIKNYVIIKPFPNAAGRMLPVGNVGPWSDRDAKELIKDGLIELYESAKHGQLTGAWAFDMVPKQEPKKAKAVKKDIEENQSITN